jgi:hypothetical protein
MLRKKRKQCAHHAYLLRCWQNGELADDQPCRWRFSVEEILQRRSRRGFESLDALVDFLRADLDDGESDPEDHE